MKIWGLLRNATLGWIDIVAGRAKWRQRFQFSPAGLIAALVLYGLVALIATMFDIGDSGAPTAIAATVLVEMLSALAIAIAALLVQRAAGGPGSVLELIVPGIFALVPYVLLRSYLVALGSPAVTLILVGLGFLLYRLGRMAGPWRMPAALAFAVLVVVLLVGMPLTLYIVGSPANSPI